MQTRLHSYCARAARAIPSAVVGCGVGSVLAIVSASCNPTPKPVISESCPIAPTTKPAPEKAMSFECRWTNTPIKIDGKGDDAGWKNAQVVDHFVIPWKTGDERKAKEATRAKVLWDREYFYYFAEMDDVDLYADVKDHNGTIWNNDAFEVFMKPAADKGGYYEFEVNPLNARMEMFLPERGAGGYPRFAHESKIEHETAVQLNGGTLNHWQDKDKGWSVEGRIAWRDMAYSGGRPNVGETWTFALCRVNISLGVQSPELTSNAPYTVPNYHHHEDFAPLKFVRADMLSPTTAPSTTAPAVTDTSTFGMPTRPLWTSSHVVGSPDAPLPFMTAKAFPKLTVKQPLYVVDETGTGNYLLLQHLGNWSGPSQVVRFKNDPDVETTEKLLTLDHLVYGMTLHPDFVHNGYLYVIANGPVPKKIKQNRILRYTVDRKAPFHIDPKSELNILEWDSNGHNGGDLGFGPDGYLYHASGDGSSDSDADDRGQNPDFLTSKMLRLDVDHPADGKPYSVPKDNPWVGTPGFQPEAWAMGFRNPWRMAFDRKTGALWVGQNGQDLWEMVNLVHKGENYGWCRFEGSHPFQPLRKAPPIPVTPPIVEHPHSEMRSLTGGIVYRGSKYPELDGAFIYGDWSTGRIFGVKSDDGKKASWHKELARTTMQIGGFHESPEGDILVMDQGGAAINKLVKQAHTSVATNFPKKLSETGLFESTKDNKVEAALIPYDVNSPLWSDGAAKQRYMAIPAGGTIGVSGSRAWDFPEGTVLVKTFAMEMEQGNPATSKRLETRLMTRQQGQWAGYTYLWNDEQTDATLIDAAGIDKTYTISDASAPEGKRKQTWHYPSRAECMTCHSRAMGFVLGTTTIQLNRDYVYPNGIKDNQLRNLEHLGLLRVDYMSNVREKLRKELMDKGTSEEKANQEMAEALATRDQREVKPNTGTLLAFNPEHIDRLANPMDANADLNARAQSYLHANCAICHVEAGGGNALMVLEYGVNAARGHTVDVKPQHDSFGLPDAKLIAAGHPDSSVLLHRVGIRGPGQMPPLASSRVDDGAVKMLREWIEKMPPAPAEKVDAGK